MPDTIIVAIITGVVTLAGVLISNSRSDAIQSERIEQIRTDIKRLEDKQSKHNQLIERVYKLEGESTRHDDEFKRVNHRLDDLEKE